MFIASAELEFQITFDRSIALHPHLFFLACAMHDCVPLHAAVRLLLLLLLLVGTGSFVSGQCVNQTLTASTGTISDGSAPDAFYGNDQTCYILIQPDDHPISITLHFTRFATEVTRDQVSIYDGNTTADPLLATLSGADLPSDKSSTGSAMLVVFITDWSIATRGWEATYSSAYATNINVVALVVGLVAGVIALIAVIGGIWYGCCREPLSTGSSITGSGSNRSSPSNPIPLSPMPSAPSYEKHIPSPPPPPLSNRSASYYTSNNNNNLNNNSNNTTRSDADLHRTVSQPIPYPTYNPRVSELPRSYTYQQSPLPANDQPPVPEPFYTGDQPPPPPPSSDYPQSHTCCVCLAAEASVVFLPCKHMCCCSTCSSSLGQCPLCRSNIAQRFEPYLT